MDSLFSRFSSGGISLGTIVGALFNMSNGIHPINALALICGAFASISIGYYHLRKK
jgi:hypothetical protein